MAKLEVKDVDYFPRCPHCEKELPEIHRVQIGIGFLGGNRHSVYICPHCTKVIGVGNASTA